MDDYLSDTPLSSTPTFLCDYTKNTCSKGQINDLPDMIENYMDYSPEKCLRMFTKEQVLLMQFNLMVNRNQLFTYLVQSQTDPDKLDNTVFIYPNPSLNYIYIEKCFNDSINNSVMNCEIIDMSGKLVSTFVLETIINKQDISALSAGIYTFYFKSKNFKKVIRFCKF